MNSEAVEPRIAGFIAKYTPEMAAAIVDARARMRTLFPRGQELVFDNHNALVFGFAASEKASQSFVSIAAYPRWLTLFFLHGAALDDPARLLEGDGSQVRGIRLKTPQDLDDARVQRLLDQAMQPYAAALLAAPPLRTIIKMEAAKQRPRRPAV